MYVKWQVGCIFMISGSTLNVQYVIMKTKTTRRPRMLSCTLVTIFHIYQLLNFENMQYWYRNTGKSSFDSSRRGGTSGEGVVLAHRLVPLAVPPIVTHSLTALAVGLSVLAAPVTILDCYFQDKDDTKYQLCYKVCRVRRLQEVWRQFKH